MVLKNATVYQKDFDNFYDGVDAVCEAVSGLKRFFKDARSEEEAMQNLFEEFLTNAPTTTNGNFPYTFCIKINSRGVIFDTDKRLSFGWRPWVRDGRKWFTFSVYFPNAKTKTIAETNLVNEDWKKLPPRTDETNATE